ncbi:MAG: hypothetical protein R3E52_09810 [Burkholderiaceae bacterium]
MQRILQTGLIDVLGFVGGALVGYWLARAAGIDALRDLQRNAGVLAIAAIGLCGGIGLGAARRWRESRRDTPSGN